MSLTITFNATVPAVTVTRGRQAYPWENDLAILRDQRPDIETLVKVYGDGTKDENSKEARGLTTKIRNRVAKVLPGEVWTIRAWPVDEMIGDVSRARYGVWVTYKGERSNGKTVDVGNVGGSVDVDAGPAPAKLESVKAKAS